MTRRGVTKPNARKAGRTFVSLVKKEITNAVALGVEYPPNAIQIWRSPSVLIRLETHVHKELVKGTGITVSQIMRVSKMGISQGYGEAVKQFTAEVNARRKKKLTVAQGKTLLEKKLARVMKNGNELMAVAKKIEKWANPPEGDVKFWEAAAHDALGHLLPIPFNRAQMALTALGKS
ncbi:MAG: hypothetical protein QGI60_01285 [archaeon]|nr:hypothetical protein [archaeon]